MLIARVVFLLERGQTDRTTCRHTQSQMILNLSSLQFAVELPCLSSGVLHPIHVSRFLVNAARPPTLDATIVLVRVCSPSVSQYISYKQYLSHTCTHSCTHACTQRFYGPLGLCPGLPGWANTRNVYQCGFTGARDSINIQQQQNTLTKNSVKFGRAVF